jgi:hypothetical protein
MARYKKCLSFAAYKKCVQFLGITSVAELKSRQDEMPNAPSNPNIIYRNDGWKGHADLFGENGIRGGKSNQHHGESHGGKASPELRAWQNMMSRCLNYSSNDFRYYGAVGVTVCVRWREFKNFLADFGRKPSRLHSGGRIGDVGDYEPGTLAGCHRRNKRRRNGRNTRRGTTSRKTTHAAVARRSAIARRSLVLSPSTQARSRRCPNSDLH